MASLIPYAFAQQIDATKFGSVLDPLIKNIVNPVIQLLFAIGIIVFAWGVAQMVWNGDDPDARDQGKRHMLWGVIGMFIMVSAWGIIYLVANTIRGI